MKKEKNKEVLDIKLVNPLIKRLDAIIKLLIEENKIIYKKEFTESKIAKLLYSVELTPTEIAKILGKKSASEIAPYLYSKKKSDKNGKS
jgi:hypothetical protein